MDWPRLCESLKTGARWRPVPYAEATLEMLPTEAGVVLAHTGFARATPVTRHTRTIELEANGLRVHDAFEGQGAADVEFHWQFGPSFILFDASRSTMSGADGEVSVEIVELGAPRDTGRWNAKIRNGWISRSYGELIPMLGLSLRSQVRLPARIVTRFRLQSAEKLQHDERIPARAAVGECSIAESWWSTMGRRLSQGDWVAFLDVIAYARSSLPGLLRDAVVR